MARIRIDAGELQMALEDSSGLHSYYLDKETGEVIFLPEDVGVLSDSEETRELEEQLEENPDRYEFIDPIPSHEAFRIMEDFVDSLPDSEEKRLLEKVLSWKKPFRNFKDALCDMGPLRDQWFAFHDARLARMAEEWLEVSSIDAELVHPGKRD